MTEQEIAAILNDVAGHPVSGAVHDIIPAMARAIHAAQTRGNTGAEHGGEPRGRTGRVVKAPETR